MLAVKSAHTTHIFIDTCSKGQRLSSLMPCANRQHLSKGHIFPRLYVLHVACVLHLTQSSACARGWFRVADGMLRVSSDEARTVLNFVRNSSVCSSLRLVTAPAPLPARARVTIFGNSRSIKMGGEWGGRTRESESEGGGAGNALDGCFEHACRGGAGGQKVQGGAFWAGVSTDKRVHAVGQVCVFVAAHEHDVYFGRCCTSSALRVSAGVSQNVHHELRARRFSAVAAAAARFRKIHIAMVRCLVACQCMPGCMRCAAFAVLRQV